MMARTARTGLGRGLALGSLLALILLAAGCAHSSGRPSAPVSLLVPSRLTVATVDVAGVYDTVARYIADVGLLPDPQHTAKPKAMFVSKPKRCSPNGDERHTGMCVFTLQVGPAPENPTRVAVSVRVHVPERVEFDPKAALDQIRIEATLDRLVTELRNRFGTAEVAQSDTLQF